MKLLFDQNLSPRLVKALADIFPNSIHTRDVGLSRATDPVVWEYALKNDCIIVSKDSDFQQRIFLFGPPPRVVWIRKGNCSTNEIERILRAHRADLELFVKDKSAALLTLD